MLWKPFDHKNPPPNGVYWVACYSEFPHPSIGQHRHVALVRLTNYGDRDLGEGGIDFDPIELPLTIGNWVPPGSVVTHFHEMIPPLVDPLLERRHSDDAPLCHCLACFAEREQQRAEMQL